MMDKSTYIQLNKATWNARVPVHLGSEMYDVQGFLNSDRDILPDLDLGLLGEIRGKNLLHLQCHFGMDTLNLARRGALVTGIDFSEAAILEANELTKRLGLDARFICSDIFDLQTDLYESFDIIYTSYGTIGWLPDISKWAETVNYYLKPGGTFVLVEFHPFVWAFDSDMKAISYDYFNSDPILEEEEGSYADRYAPIRTKTMSWNHGLAEVISALLERNLQLSHFSEHDYSPYNCFSKLSLHEPGKYRFSHIPYRIPMVYAVKVTKKLV